jgi:hypothetical protein
MVIIEKRENKVGEDFISIRKQYNWVNKICGKSKNGAVTRYLESVCSIPETTRNANRL